jgi:hypothetical protein
LLYSYNGILLHNKKKEITNTCKDVKELPKHAGKVMHQRTHATGFHLKNRQTKLSWNSITVVDASGVGRGMREVSEENGLNVCPSHFVH